MRVKKVIDESRKVIPLIAALPYEINYENTHLETSINYTPERQRTALSGRGYSTCREDDSVWRWALSQKSDTKKDD